MTKYIITALLTITLYSCGSINMFTKFEKLPREHSENYHKANIKAKKDPIHKTAWIVYSTQPQVATIEAGGRLKSKDVTFFQPLIVINDKDKYLEVIKYNAENIKNNKFVEKAKAEYIGWLHKDNLLLSPVAITDTYSGKKSKLLTAITDTAMFFTPEVYFVKADSLKTYSEPSLQNTIGVVGLNEIVYAVKINSTFQSVLLFKSMMIDAEKSIEQQIGWVPSSTVANIGKSLFVNSSRHQSVWNPATMKYTPIVESRYTDSVMYYNSGTVSPIIDRSKRKVYNIDGGAITYNESLEIRENLHNLNIHFALEGGVNISKQYPQIINSIQNLKEQFPATDSSFRYSFAATIVSNNGIVTIPKTSSHDKLMKQLLTLIPQMQDSTASETAWVALQECITNIDAQPNSQNIIIHIGEIGSEEEAAPEHLHAMLSENNCRLFGWQAYATEGNRYNNYVLQLTSMIDIYSAYQTKAKRAIILYAEQLKGVGQYKTIGRNHYFLDPEHSISHGSVIFPDNNKTLSYELFASSIDSLVATIKSDITLLDTSFDKAFNAIGDDSDFYIGKVRSTYALNGKDTIPTKSFKEMYKSKNPIAYIPSVGLEIELADSLVEYRLMVSDSELKEIKEFIGILSEKEVDRKSSAESDKDKSGKICEYVNSEGVHNEISILLSENKIIANADSTYRSTRKIRKHLKKAYFSQLRKGSICPLSNCKSKHNKLSHVHKAIFEVESNNPLFSTITIRDIKKRRRFSDRELDELITYFKECKALFEKEHTKEKFTSLGETYYYINPEILP